MEMAANFLKTQERLSEETGVPGMLISLPIRVKN